MLHPYGIWSLVPPLAAIVLAVASRQVYLSLAAGVWVGYVILDGSLLGGTTAALDGCVQVFADAGNTRVIIFSVLVGALIALFQRSGGVDGFVQRVQATRLVSGPRSAGLLTMAIGMAVFIESSISALVTGTVGRPLFDRLYISREKLAYVCDTCSAPTCMLIPLNGWGAFVLAQLAILGVDDPVGVLARSLPLNFYAILSLTLLVVLLATGKDFGPMRRAQRRALLEHKLHADGARPLVADEIISLRPDAGVTARSFNFLLPLAVMVLMAPIGLAYTGFNSLAEGAPATFWNVLQAGSGSTAVLWAVVTAIVFAGMLYRAQGIMTVRELVDVSLKGAGGLLPLGVLMTLAFALGQLCGNDRLGTGTYVASLVGDQTAARWIAPVLFVVSSVIAFSTGTSWGTFAIMLAIAIPLAEQTGVRQELLVAAALGGGVFGDHCSPISDTTVISSMAAACDHIDHVRTQLPYALVAGLAAALMYALVA